MSQFIFLTRILSLLFLFYLFIYLSKIISCHFLHGWKCSICTLCLSFSETNMNQWISFCPTSSLLLFLLTIIFLVCNTGCLLCFLLRRSLFYGWNNNANLTYIYIYIYIRMTLRPSKRLVIAKGVRSPPNKATCWRWWRRPVMLEDGILMTEKTVTRQLKQSHDLQYSNFGPYSARQAVREAQSDKIDWSAPIWLSGLYPSDCSCGEQVSNPISS